MNKQLLHVSVAALVLLAALIVSTTYWQTWAVGDLADRQDNSIQLVSRLTVDRGKILAGGRVLATNRRHRKHGLTIFTRRYPSGALAPQVIGYATAAGTTTGLEETLDDYLTGANTNLTNTFKEELRKLGGQTVHGDNVILTLRPAVQALALQELAGRCGAVVALDAKTGAVYAMASSPTYDANLIEQPKGFGQVVKIKGTCGDSSALVNNATAGLYPPGSTFKLITASAALDTGAYTPTSQFYDPGYCVEYGQRVYNSSAPDSPSGHETFGNVDFSSALEHSINAVFCKIGMHIGAKTILEYAKRYGFYSLPPLDLPPTAINASGLYAKGRLHYPKDFNTVDVGRLAFGQEKMLVTPLQMALVAAGVANGGTIMEPHLVKKVTAPGGSKTVAKTKPKVWKHAMKPSTAATLNTMMQAVITGGTATGVQIPGITWAGKTGTAETCDHCNVYDAWFIFFAPADHPVVAGAVVIEHSVGGFGGAVAAPIAKQLVQAILPTPSK